MKSQQLSNVQILGGMFGVFSYALLGSPSPDVFGIVEIIILLSLVLLISHTGLSGVVKFVSDFQERNSPLIWLYCLFLWGTVVGVSGGFFRGNSFDWIVRDYISFLFLCLPLFFLSHLSNPLFHTIILRAILLMGTLFSVRILWGEAVDTGTASALYLSISPEVLMVATYSMMMMVYYCVGMTVSKRSLYKKWGIILLYIGMSALSLLVLYQSVMRAGLVAMSFCVVIFLLWGLIYRPRNTFFLISILLGSILIFYGSLFDFIAPFLQKQKDLGANLRFEELQAVSTQIGSSALHQFIGLGWGAGLESPSSAGLFVNFTHGLLSSLWLKTGFIGVGLMVVFMMSTIKHCVTSLQLFSGYHVIVFTSLMITISINMVLYGGYKSLGFGLCLTLLMSLLYRLKDKGQAA